jgi:hypothetical protein
MIKNNGSLIISFIFLLTAICCKAQDLDLIINTKGDSLACRIDGIVEANIYFKMNNDYRWIQIIEELPKVSHIERDAVEKGHYVDNLGTPLIKSAYTDEIRRNSVYVGILTINYSRTFYGNPVGVTLAGGLIFFDEPGIVIESTLLIGGTKHFFEPGINGFCIFDPSEGGVAVFYDLRMIGGSFRMGYRFQGPKGFLFRIGPQLSIYDGHVAILPAGSIGFSF